LEAEPAPPLDAEPRTAGAEIPRAVEVAPLGPGEQLELMP
jgi:hypothetical protein